MNVSEIGTYSSVVAANPFRPEETYEIFSVTEEEDLLTTLLVTNKHPSRIRSLNTGRVVAIAAIVGAVGAGGGLAAADSSSSPKTAQDIPNQVQVLGPNGQVEGTVPKTDIIAAPANQAPGAGAGPVADTPGALIVIDGRAGFPVTRGGILVGYWAPPMGFISISQAKEDGATPTTGADPVGSK
jgi:hypothetical protein